MTLKGGHQRRPKVATSQKVAAFGFPVQLASFFLKAANGLWVALQRRPTFKKVATFGWPPLDTSLADNRHLRRIVTQWASYKAAPGTALADRRWQKPAIAVSDVAGA